MRACARAASLAAIGVSLCFGGGELRAQASAESPQPAAQPALADAPAPARPPAPAVPAAASAPSGFSAPQLYNLANAYARSGQTALAVLAYERARVLAPTDPDLLANLHRVRESAGLPTSSGSWLEHYGRFANPNVWYWVGIAGLALGGGCLLMLRRQAGFRALLGAGATLGLVLAGASSLNAAATFGALSESVVLRQAPAGVSPVAGAEPLFSIPAAATVRVLDRHAGFELIRDSQGREGWVAAGDLAAVIPLPADRT